MLEEIIIAALIVAVAYLLFKNKMWQVRFEQRLMEWQESKEKEIREDAISRSARSLSGKTLEKMVPFLDRFPYDPHDVRWLGDPIDLVIFDGKSSGKTDQIVFCEVKSGDSHLTESQKGVKEAIESKKVKWAEFRV